MIIAGFLVALVPAWAMAAPVATASVDWAACRCAPLTAVLTFMGAGFVTVFVTRHLLGI